MKLSPRLITIANLVPKNSTVADVGTDHGYIPVYLVQNNISNKVIAADVNEGPLESAIQYVTSEKLNHKIDTRLGDGLKVLSENEVDTVIIAGMGGILIAEIIEQSKALALTFKNFILQPMVASEDLRKYLYDNGYKITNEKLAREDNRAYEILFVEHGKEELEDEIYFEVGKKLIENNDPLLKFFLNKKIEKYTKIINNIKDNNSINGKSKYEKIIKKIQKFEEVINKL